MSGWRAVGLRVSEDGSVAADFAFVSLCNALCVKASTLTTAVNNQLQLSAVLRACRDCLLAHRDELLAECECVTARHCSHSRRPSHLVLTPQPHVTLVCKQRDHNRTK